MKNGIIRKHGVTFLIWLAFFNWPPILVWIPSLGAACFLPFLFWINIPALWLGLADLVGKPHFIVEEFGAVPQTTVAWVLIALFWITAALGMTVIAGLIVELVFQKGKAGKPELQKK